MHPSTALPPPSPSRLGAATAATAVLLGGLNSIYGLLLSLSYTYLEIK